MLVNTAVLRPYLAMVRAVLYEYSCVWLIALVRVYMYTVNFVCIMGTNKVNDVNLRYWRV